MIARFQKQDLFEMYGFAEVSFLPKQLKINRANCLLTQVLSFEIQIAI